MCFIFPTLRKRSQLFSVHRASWIFPGKIQYLIRLSGIIKMSNLSHFELTVDIVLSDMTVLTTCYKTVILIKNTSLHISVSYLPKFLQNNANNSTSRYLNVNNFTVMKDLQTHVDPLLIHLGWGFAQFHWDLGQKSNWNETWCTHVSGIRWWSFAWNHIWRHIGYSQPKHSGDCCGNEWMRFLFFPVPPRVNFPHLFCVVVPWWWHQPIVLYSPN